MIRVLLAKEIRESGSFAAMLWLVYSALVLLLAWSPVARAQGSTSLGEIVGTLGVLCGVLLPVLASRLITTEYQHRTIRFLEGLPLRPWVVLTVKYGLGLGCVLAAAAWTIGAGFAFAPYGGLSALYVAVVSVRVLAFVFAWWGVVFAHAMVGRYRWPTAFAVVLAYTSLHVRGVFDGETDPLALVSWRLVQEHTNAPWPHICAALVVGLVVPAIAVAFASGRGATTIEGLFVRMTRIEKGWIGAGLVVLMYAATTLSATRTLPPYEIPGATQQGGDGQVVAVDDHGTGHLEGLAAHAHQLLVASRAELGLDTLPPVFIVERRDLDTVPWSFGHLRENEGILVEVNPEAPGFDVDELVGQVVHQGVRDRTARRASLEGREWAVDGLRTWWAHRDDVPFSNPLYRARLGFALRQGVSTPSAIARWDTLQVRVGEQIADAVGWSMLETMRVLFGTDRTLAFLRDLWPSQTSDLRATIADWRDPWEDRFRRATGMPWTQFLTTWHGLVQAMLSHDPATGRGGSPPSGSIAINGSGPVRRVVWRVDAPSADAPAEVVLRYASLSWRSSWIGAAGARVDRADTQIASRGIELPRGVGVGTRLGWRMEWYDPSLGCLAVSPWTKTDVGP